jgi:hypothetical protein
MDYPLSQSHTLVIVIPRTGMKAINGVEVGIAYVPIDEVVDVPLAMMSSTSSVVAEGSERVEGAV